MSLDEAPFQNELYESMKSSCGGIYVNVDALNPECSKHIEEFKKSVSRIDTDFVLDSNCDTTSPDCYRYRFKLSEYWANNESVRRALKVVKGTKGKWERCNFSVKCHQDIKSTIPYHKNNTNEGYRSLIFSGDHDMKIIFVSTRAWIKSLNYSITDKWRPWMILDRVAGYTQF